MSRLTTFSRRVCAALMLLSLSVATTFVHAQYLSFHIDAPNGIDYDVLRQDIGTLKITFSNRSDFQNVKKYEEHGYDLAADFKNSYNDNSIRYCSYDLSLNAGGEDEGAWWGNANLAAFNVRDLRRILSISSSQPIYYRIYSPHFSRNRILVGEITPSDEQRITFRHDDWAPQSHRVAFQPVVGRDGTKVEALLAPDLRIGTCNGTYSYSNMYELTEPFAVYTQVGDTLRYLVAPKEENLALHADSVLVTDTTTCVTSDFRKATLCYFYITDTKGNLCPTQGGLGSVYYPQKLAVCLNTGSYGYGFYNVNGTLTLTAADGTKGAYVLPGTQIFQYSRPSVQTTDPDFLMPYNGQSWYVIGQVTIPASTEPVNLSVGKSSPMRVVTTLTDAAPYADNLNLRAVSYVSAPYAWGNDIRINIESREVSRQVQGNDLVITTLVEGSTSKPALKLTANYSAHSDTIAAGINAEASFNDEYYPPIKVDNEYRFTQEQFALDSTDNPYQRVNFSTLHPIKFVIPCHLMQEGYKLISDFPLNFVATHHEGCAKLIALGSESPIPYDTLTVILPEDQFYYRWYMKQGKTKPADDHIFKFKLEATGPFEQHLPDNQFAMLRVTNLGVDSVYVFNDVPDYKLFESYNAKYNAGNKQLYYAREAIPLHAGYNEHTIEYRQIKIEKDTFNTVNYWVNARYGYRDEDGSYHPSYTSYTRPDVSGTLERMQTNTPDNAINISTLSWANLAVTAGSSFDPAYLIEVAPSDADTIVSIYKSRYKKTNFTFNGESVMPGFEWLNMCFNNQQTHVAPGYIFNNRRGTMNLLPGHYTVEGVAWVENAETGHADPVPFSTTFDVPSSGIVELNPSITEGISSVPAGDGGAPQVQARFTIDGRRIATPQPGVNIVKMTDGTVHKVIVK